MFEIAPKANLPTSAAVREPLARRPRKIGAVAVTTANNFNNEIQFAMLPLGFLKMALEKNATVSKEKKFTVLSFPMENGTAYKTTVKGYIDDKGLVDRVETMIDQGMLGDTKWEATFSNYKDFGGVKFPTSIVQRQGGPKILGNDGCRCEGQPACGPDASGRARRPGSVRAAPGEVRPRAAPEGGARGGPGGGGRGAPAAIESEDLGGGFWLVTGGYGAVVANFKDYIVVIEGPSGDVRADQIITEAKRLVPEQADQVRHQHARALRSLAGTARLCGRGRDHHHESGEQGLLREGPGQSSHAGSGQSAENESEAQDQGGIRRRREEDHRRRTRD